MTNKNSFVSLYNALDDVFNAFSSVSTASTNSNTYTTTTDSVGFYRYDPYEPYSPTITYPLSKWITWWDTYTPPKVEVDSYPVANCYLEQDGTCILQIATTGFSKEQIKVKREDNTIIVEGKKEEKDKNIKKYLFHKIAERDFTISYKLSNKLDFDKISVKMENGILEIKLPLKEENKPVIKELEIK